MPNGRERDQGGDGGRRLGRSWWRPGISLVDEIPYEERTRSDISCGRYGSVDAA